MKAAPQLELALDGTSGGREVGKAEAEGSAAPRPAAPTSRLPDRLYALGLPADTRVQTHANRRVLVSLTARGGLRVHLGYAMAPDAVLAAIARWARPRIPRGERRAAQRILAAFPVHEHVPPARGPRRLTEQDRPGDERTLARLRALHQDLNTRHFAGALGPVILLLSSRMRRRLGEFRPPGSSDAPAEISISRRHLRRDGWRGVRETLAHGMVHQWQAETGRKLGHGPDFRRRCTAMGIDPNATRRLQNDLLR